MKAPQSHHKIVRYSDHLAAPVEQVFPLLCPIREKEWLEGWSCTLLHSESGFAEKGAVFTTPYRPEGPSQWVVSRHDINLAIEFIVLFPDSHVVLFQIEVEPEGTGCRVCWTGRFTSLVPDNPFLAEVDEAWFVAIQKPIHVALEHFCRTGRMLRKDGEPR